MEREKLAERIEFLTGDDKAGLSAYRQAMQELKDNDPTGELLKEFCN